MKCLRMAAGDVRQHLVAVFEFDAELRIGQCFHNFAFDFNGLFFGHSVYLLRKKT